MYLSSSYDVVVVTLMAILAPRLILNIRREYYAHVPGFSTTGSTIHSLTWNAGNRMGTSHDDNDEPAVGIWSAEVGGCVTGRRIVSEMGALEEEE